MSRWIRRAHEAAASRELGVAPAAGRVVHAGPFEVFVELYSTRRHAVLATFNRAKQAWTFMPAPPAATGTRTAPRRPRPT